MRRAVWNSLVSSPSHHTCITIFIFQILLRHLFVQLYLFSIPSFRLYPCTFYILPHTCRADLMSLLFTPPPPPIPGEWLRVDEGVGLNQYDMYLPHARYKHTGVPLSDTTFVFFGGCARFAHIYPHSCSPLMHSW